MPPFKTALLSSLFLHLLLPFFRGKVLKVLLEVGAIVLGIRHFIEGAYGGVVVSGVFVSGLSDPVAGDGTGTIFALVAALSNFLEEVLNIHNVITAIPAYLTS
jgi:hypothetical protein